MARLTSERMGSEAAPLPVHRTFGKSTAGFLAKKSKGRSSNSCQAVGMMGQSSGRVTWWKPSVYQTTISVFSIGRLALVHAGRPSPPWLCVG